LTQPASGELPAIQLRAPTRGDADDFIAAAKASAALHHPWYRAPLTRREWHEYVDRCATETHSGYLIVDPADGGLAGIATVSNIIRGSFWSAHLGYAALAPRNGRGRMTAGIAAVLDDAFGRIGLHRLEANVQPGNAPSRALVERLGFRLEGFSPRYLTVNGAWRDHDRWAILSEEWRESPLRRSR
jgi:ribosomal-protein-alanine N-acetyltransferase